MLRVTCYVLRATCCSFYPVPLNSPNTAFDTTHNTKLRSTQYPPVFGTQDAPQGPLLAHAHNFSNTNRTQTKSCLFKDQYIFLSVLTNEPDIYCTSAAATCTLVQITARYVVFFRSFYFPFSLVLLLLQQRDRERERDREMFISI